MPPSMVPPTPCSLPELSHWRRSARPSQPDRARPDGGNHDTGQSTAHAPQQRLRASLADHGTVSPSAGAFGKAREVKERQTEITLRIEQHQKGEGLPHSAENLDFRGFAGCRAIRAFEHRAETRASGFRLFEPAPERQKATIFFAFALRPDGQSRRSFELAGDGTIKIDADGSDAELLKIIINRMESATEGGIKRELISSKGQGQTIIFIGQKKA